ncbi:hypothetical protein DL96DRAFT_1477579 [Flagelloscypha sp. PMI_526]|nr:hypothetical protein DL96DRAFT_1477579 [Flagelloscypha sp. PMI_526]
MRRAALDCPELTSNDARINSSTISVPEALPCKCFDLIVGSGDGGWIAIMLGRLGMSTTEVIETYLQIRASIHDTYPYNGHPDRWEPDAKGAFFDALLQLLVTSKVESGASQEMIQNNPSCFTLVCPSNNAPHPALFRNYTGRQGSLPNCPIWIAMRAAASSVIFPPTTFTPANPKFPSQKFLGASQFNFNNPVDEAITEALELSRKRKISGPLISCLVSLGSGHPGFESLCDSDLARVTIQLTKSATSAHDKACRRFLEAEKLDHEAYFRFNVDQGLQQILLVDIPSGVVRTHTEAYLSSVDVDNLIEHAVQRLVETGKVDHQENHAGLIASTSREHASASECCTALFLLNPDTTKDAVLLDQESSTLPLEAKVKRAGIAPS